MVDNKYEYKYYQNVTIRWYDFYDRSGYKLTSNPPNGYISLLPYNGENGLIPFENDPSDEQTLNPTNNGRLDILFKVDLNPPNLQPKKIEIKNINASLTSSSGNGFELSSSLIRYPIQFLDSLSTFTKYEEYTNSQIKLTTEWNLKRISGSEPLMILVNNPPYLINPSLSFTIVYHYY